MDVKKLILTKIFFKEQINFKEIAEQSNYLNNPQDVKNYIQTLQQEGYVRGLEFIYGGIGEQVIGIDYDNSELSRKGILEIE